MRYLYLSILFTGFFCALNSSAQKQQDTIIQLQAVEVYAPRLNEFGIGTVVERIDSADKQFAEALTLGQLLGTHSGLTIKSYGVGGLSNVSLRGGGTSHTAVVWNGINIQSPMNSGINLSVLPASFADEISIQHGGSGTLYGSGAVTGVIHINSKTSLQEPNYTFIHSSIGSFNNKSIALKVKTGTSKFASTYKIFNQSSDHDFEFENTAKYKSPVEKQTNAGVFQYGFMQDNTIKITDRSTLKTALWYQHHEKGIQTQMTNSLPSRAFENQDDLVFTMNWRQVLNKQSLNYKSGYIYDRIKYNDPDLDDLKTLNRSSSFVQELESKFQLKQNQLLNIGLNYTYEEAVSGGYAGNVHRNRLSVFSSYKYKALKDRLNAVLSARGELTQGAVLPPVFSFGIDYSLAKFLTVKGNVSKNYRLPTFNDLFWQQGQYAQGNPDLVPESGWSAELGFEERFVRNEFRFNCSQTYFLTQIDNWIIWLPNVGDIWMPYNKEQGKSYGIESMLNTSWKKGRSSINLNSSYTWSHARIFSDDEYDGKPMIYVPDHRVMSALGYGYRDASVRVVFNGFSERMYDNRHVLDSYMLTDLILSYRIQIKQSHLTTSFKVLNVFDETYQVMAWYAMPMRNYQLSVSIKF